MAEFSASALINEVLKANQQSAQVLDQGQMDLSRLGTQAEQGYQQFQTGMASAVAGAQEVAGAKAAIEYTRDTTVQKIQSLYGMDPESADFVVARNMAEYNAARTERRQVRQDYDKLASVDFLSNPLGWIVAQAQLPQVAAKNNALADAEDDALNEISDLTARLNASKTTIVANTADAVRANSLQSAAVGAQEAQANLALKGAENASRLAGIKMQQVQLADKKNDNVRSAVSTIASVQNMEETRLLRAEAAADRKESSKLRDLQIQAILDEKTATAEQDAELDARLKIVSDNMGLKLPMTMRRVRVLLDKEEKAYWINAAATAKYGKNLGEAVTFVQERGNLQTMQNTGSSSIVALVQKLKDAGREEADQVSRQYSAQKLREPGTKVPNPEALEKEGYEQYETRIIGSTMRQGTKEDLSSAAWDKKFNPYVAPLLSFSAAVETQPEYAGLRTNLVKQHIDTLVKSGVIKGENLTTDQQKQVLSAIQSQIMQSGAAGSKLDPKKAAADVAAYFRAAASYNLGMNQYTNFALPVQQKYLFTQPNSGPQVDLFDPVDVENMLARGVKNTLRDQKASFGYTAFGYR